MSDSVKEIEWTFLSECDTPKSAQNILLPGEKVYAAYRTIRDVAMVTDKRLIVSDVQGVTGKKNEIYSVPWHCVEMWSSETRGHFDLSAEVEIWTRALYIKIIMRPGIDVRRFDAFISACALN